MVTVHIPAMLRPLAGGAASFAATGGTVRAVLEDVRNRHSSLIERIMDGNGLRPEVFVAINGEEAFGLDQAVPDGSELYILPAIAGGQAMDGRGG